MSGHLPREVFCAIDQLHQSLTVADQVSEGVFDLGGESRSLGPVPDWTGGDFPADEEWHIELSKFYFGLDLAYAYLTTGDKKYSEAWRTLVMSWIDQVKVDSDPTDVAARRIQNWTYAWARFGAILDSEDSKKVLTSIADQIAYIRANLAAERNHRTLELYSLFSVALAHPTLDHDGSLAAFAAWELHRNLRADILPDGVHRERSTHYHAIALRSFLGARVNADRFGIELPNDYNDRLVEACFFLGQVVRPDGSLPMLSDSDGGDYSDLLALAGEHLGRPDLLWIATAGAKGEAPADVSTVFSDGGYCIHRSGWGNQGTAFVGESQLIFDCGPVGDSGHGHYDALHVELYGASRPLVIDPGRYTYSEAGSQNLRHWFKGTAAHNTVCVDGLDQIGYRRGKPKGPVSQTRLLSTRSGPVAEFVAETVSPMYDAIHRRRVLAVADDAWIIHDSLRAHENHRYDLRFHLDSPALDHTHVSANEVVSAPGMTLTVSGGVPHIEEGWIAPSYGIRRAAPIISIVTEGSDVEFVTVIAPARAGQSQLTAVIVDSSYVKLNLGSQVASVRWDNNRVEWQPWR